MDDITRNEISAPAMGADALTELLKAGARELIAQAVETELSSLLLEHQGAKLPDGRQAVVRNGYLPERKIQTGLGEVKIQVPKIRDRSKSGIKFTSSLLPPYLKRTKCIEELIPWLYLKGISTGDYQEALCALLGPNAKGLSANTISRLKSDWLLEYEAWQKRDLSEENYVYIWADGIYSNVRMDDRLCLLVIMGVTDQGNKVLLAVEDGYRESEDSWREVLLDLKQRGLEAPPRLAVGDGAMGFWNAIEKIYPACRHQRCWVHKTRNVLSKLPKAVQPKVKEAIHNIYGAEKKEDAEKAFKRTLARFEAKYPKAMKCLEKDHDSLLAFYDFPAEHWVHIRTTNPIESAFATVRLRAKKSKNCGSRETTLCMVFKLLQTAQNKWRKIRGFQLLELVVNNQKFQNGELIEQEAA